MSVDQILALSIEKKIGQLFFIGITGTEADGDVSALIKEISPGGICLFARNVRTAEQVRKLLDDIRESSEIEPFMSLDQEGGLVDRLRRISAPMPAAGSIRTIDEATSLAKITAGMIRILGFNMNFAPVIDVMNEERAKFSNGLYSRAFGKSKDEVIEFAGNYLKELRSGGIIGCLKHFPGLGGATRDAHNELPRVEISDEELQTNDLAPYRALLRDQEVIAVMVAHASFPNVDLQETDRRGKLLPTTLSFNFVTKLLRDALKFEGLAITDDLEMGAIVNDYGVGEACKMAIKAGEDMLAICANASAVREGFNALIQAVQNDEISEARIDESLRRIGSAKSKIRQPLPFDLVRFNELSSKIAELSSQVNYTYGG